MDLRTAFFVVVFSFKVYWLLFPTRIQPFSVLVVFPNLKYVTKLEITYLSMLLKILSFLIFFLTPDLLPGNFCVINLQNHEKNDFFSTVPFLCKMHLMHLLGSSENISDQN